MNPDNVLVRSNKVLNEIIVALFLVQMVCAGLQPLKQFQIPAELLLLAALLYACTAITYDRWEISLLLLLCFVTAGSFLMTDVSTALVLGKQNVLVVLSFLYFSKVQFRSRLIFPTFVLTASLLILNLLAPEALAPLVSSSAFEEFNESRFGGIFQNAHFNACFMAAALIYYGHKKKLYGLGVALIYLTASKSILVAYAANVIAAGSPIKRLTKYRAVPIAIGALAIYLIFQNRSALIEVFDVDELGSAVPVLMQLFDPAYYQTLLNPFPSADFDISAEARDLYREHSGYIEVGYFHLATAGGVLLAAPYLYLLLRRTRHFRAFILVSLLHFGFVVLSPLIVYMLVTYSKEIHTLLAGTNKKRVGLRAPRMLSQHRDLAGRPA